MYKDKIMKLVKELRKNAKNKKGVMFDFGLWGRMQNQEKPISCGTTACAMGLAAISGAFEKDGLSYKIDINGGLEFKWKGRSTDGASVAAKLFKISVPHAVVLFTSSGELEDNTMGAEAERAIAKRLVAYTKSPARVIAKIKKAENEYTGYS